MNNNGTEGTYFTFVLLPNLLGADRPGYSERGSGDNGTADELNQVRRLLGTENRQESLF